MNHVLRPAAIALALLALAPAAFAAPVKYSIDKAHSEAGFEVRHFFSKVHGRFTDVQGSIVYDDQDPARISVDASAVAASVSTSNERRDGHLKTGDFFDVEKYPTLTFKSKKAEAAGQGKFSLRGDLTIHGVTKEVVLDVDGPSPEVKDPWGMTRIGATASTKIKRSDFGLTWNKVIEAGGVAVGDEVTITIDVELVKEQPKAAEPAKK